MLGHCLERAERHVLEFIAKVNQPFHTGLEQRPIGRRRHQSRRSAPLHQCDRLTFVVGNVEIFGEFVTEAILGEQRLQDAVGRAAKGYRDLRALQIFQPFHFRPSDQAKRNLIEDLQQHANLFAAKHRLHGRSKGGGIMHAARHQRLNVHRIAAQHDDIHIGQDPSRRRIFSLWPRRRRDAAHCRDRAGKHRSVC